MVLVLETWRASVLYKLFLVLCPRNANLFFIWRTLSQNSRLSRDPSLPKIYHLSISVQIQPVFTFQIKKTLYTATITSKQAEQQVDRGNRVVKKNSCIGVKPAFLHTLWKQHTVSARGASYHYILWTARIPFYIPLFSRRQVKREIQTKKKTSNFKIWKEVSKLPVWS